MIYSELLNQLLKLDSYDSQTLKTIGVLAFPKNNELDVNVHPRNISPMQLHRQGHHQWCGHNLYIGFCTGPLVFYVFFFFFFFKTNTIYIFTKGCMFCSTCHRKQAYLLYFLCNNQSRQNIQLLDRHHYIQLPLRSLQSSMTHLIFV